MLWRVSSKAVATNDSPPTSPTTYGRVVRRVELSALSGGHGSHSESWSSPNHRDHHGEQDTWQGHHGHGWREREWDAQDWSADGAPWTQPTDAPTDAHQPAGDAWNAQDWIAYGATWTQPRDAPTDAGSGANQPAWKSNDPERPHKSWTHGWGYETRRHGPGGTPRLTKVKSSLGSSLTSEKQPAPTDHTLVISSVKKHANSSTKMRS